MLGSRIIDGMPWIYSNKWYHEQGFKEAAEVDQEQERRQKSVRSGRDTGRSSSTSCDRETDAVEFYLTEAIGSSGLIGRCRSQRQRGVHLRQTTSTAEGFRSDCGEIESPRCWPSQARHGCELVYKDRFPRPTSCGIPCES